MRLLVRNGYFYVSNSSSRAFLRKSLRADEFPNVVAHHDLCIAKRFHEKFLLAGLDPNDPSFGRLVDKVTHDAWHNGKDVAHGGAFNWVWDDFFSANPEATSAEILAKLKEIRSGHKYLVPTKSGQAVEFSFR